MPKPPRDLQAIPRWVLWRFEHQPGSADFTKRPASPDGPGYAPWGNPNSWMTFHEAMEAYRRVSGYWKNGGGLGLVLLPDDDLSVIDLDGCRDPKTGALAGWAKEIIGLFDGYAEISVSGEGVHIFARGAPAYWRPQTIKIDYSPEDPMTARAPLLEVFVGRHFITISGRRLDGKPNRVHDCAEAWKALADQYEVETVKPVRTPRAAGALNSADLATVEDALGWFTSDDVDRGVWFGIGAVLRQAFGDEAARETWLAWMAQSKNNDPEASEAMWASVDDEPREMTLGTIFYLAQQEGWLPPWRIDPNEAFPDEVEEPDDPELTEGAEVFDPFEELETTDGED